MKIRYITEADVAAVLNVQTTIELLDAAARAHAAGDAMSMPRQRPRVGSTTMQVLPAAYDGRLGHKTYITGIKGAGVRFWVSLWDASTGAMLTTIEADTMGQIRTGAASGIATRALANPHAKIGTILGTGRQAWSQLEAICAVRPLEVVRIWSRTPTNAEAFRAKMQPRVKARLDVVHDVQTAVADADVICTITNASEPFLRGEWLKPGAHVNAAGSNHATKAEIDAELVSRAQTIVVEDVAQAKVESGDLLAAERAGTFSWPQAQRLCDVIAGNVPGRTDDTAITLFESLGIGLWDVAAASAVLAACEAEGRGRLVTLSED